MVFLGNLGSLRAFGAALWVVVLVFVRGALQASQPLVLKA